MFYIVYRTVNLINDKFYIGKHKTETLEFDGYLGSGKLIKQAIKKYGKNNFKRETLFIYDTEDAASLKEKEIVNEKFLVENYKICYNLHVGGEGGSKKLMIDESGNATIICCTDEERSKISVRTKNTAVYVYGDGSIKRLSKNHPDVISGKVSTYKTNTSIYYLEGKKVRLDITDPRIESGEAVHIFKGIKTSKIGGFEKEKSMYIKDGRIVYLSINDGELLGLDGMNKNTSVYIYIDGTTKRLPTNHPDVISGMAVSINKGKKAAILECPHCGKCGGSSNMKRYHFDNCKEKLID